MTKAIRSYPGHMQEVVIARRMQQYDPDGFNGMGVLSAVAIYEKRRGSRYTVPTTQKKKSNKKSKKASTSVDK